MDLDLSYIYKNKSFTGNTIKNVFLTCSCIEVVKFVPVLWLPIKLKEKQDVANQIKRKVSFCVNNFQAFFYVSASRTCVSVIVFFFNLNVIC